MSAVAAASTNHDGLSNSPHSAHFGPQANTDETRSKPIPRHAHSPTKSLSSTQSQPEGGWGANFWVTLTDPSSQLSFYACPATGQVSWDPPAGNFVLPPNDEGEWWELIDESHGIPYYYHTKTGETVWERPSGFVIPLGILQNSALGRRLSLNASKRSSLIASNGGQADPLPQRPANNRRLRSSTSESPTSPSRQQPSGKSATAPRDRRSSRRSISNDHFKSSSHHEYGSQLPPIPGSPYVSGASAPSTPVSTHPPNEYLTKSKAGSKDKDSPTNKSINGSISSGRGSLSRARSKSSSYLSHKPTKPQSLSAAVEMLSTSASESGHVSVNGRPSISKSSEVKLNTNIQTSPKTKRDVPPSPRRPIPAVPATFSWSGKNAPAPSIAGKEISKPVLNDAATQDMSPMKSIRAGKPIPISSSKSQLNGASMIPLVSETRPILPHDLASDILQFSESDYAKQYFSTHRRGFIFRRRVPVAQMMQWQRAPLTSPLLSLTKSLHKDAVRIFRIVQHIMGDREKDKTMNVRTDTLTSTVASFNSSVSSVSSTSILEEQRWILSEGLAHGELRDEIYCQIMKQLNANGNKESVFKGWQFLCVVLSTFPPSKNFETYLRSFIKQCTNQQETRIDVMSKYCLKRLDFISRKGPRGKAPTLAEIETASDAAFNPSTFGESLDAIMRLQERSYPEQKVPVILPFLATGILALGGNKAEGIFRVPGDGDSVAALRVEIDRGYYTLPDGVNDPHVLASLLKLWLRELCDPLVPEELYNECISNAKDPDYCIEIVERLPTINRHVVIFIISFLQLFLDDKTQALTKMTPANLALVMAPNLLRCNSDLMSVVFTNAQFEQTFVYNLLLHLKSDLDPEYVPVHGLGSIPNSSRPSKSRSKRPY